jgi:hypothetical protein
MKLGKTDINLRASEAFIREVLAKHFDQKTVDRKALRAAAEKLCEALPGREKKAG